MSQIVLFCSLLALLAVPLLASPQGSRQASSTVTSTKTTTTTATTTVTVPTSTICASYINASTACRRRRSGGWLDTPILLSLDDDDAFDPFNPTMVYNVEPTVLVGIVPKSAVIESSQGNDEPVAEDDSFRVAEPIYFSQLAALIPALSNVFGIPATTTVTTTSTTTSTTLTTTTTSTKPIVISGCIPPGFTYSTCAASG